MIRPDNYDAIANARHICFAADSSFRTAIEHCGPNYREEFEALAFEQLRIVYRLSLLAKRHGEDTRSDETESANQTGSWQPAAS